MEDNIEILRTAQGIRRAFQAKKKAMLGRRYTPDRTVDPAVWERAAAVCIECKASPSDYVEACFAGCREKNGPYAGAIGGKAARGWWFEYVEDMRDGSSEDDRLDLLSCCSDELLENMLEMARCFMRSRNGTCEPTEENMYIMRRPMFSIPPLARVYFGYRDSAVMNLWADKARMQLAGRPDLMDAVGRRPDFPLKELMTWK